MRTFIFVVRLKLLLRITGYTSLNSCCRYYDYYYQQVNDFGDNANQNAPPFDIILLVHCQFLNHYHLEVNHHHHHYIGRYTATDINILIDCDEC